MAYTKLGRIRPVYKGAWSSSAAYTTLDIVKSADGGTAYMALKDVPKGTALTDAAYWGVVLDVSDVLAAADEAISAANAAAALAPKPLELAETSQPAQIWPEEGSPLRPVISMLPAQSGSGDPSPENVRPISGHEAVMVTRCGKNLCPEWEQGAISDTTGANQSSENVIRTAGYVCVVPGGTYTLSRIGTADSLAVTGYDAGKNYIGSGSAVIRTLSGGNDTNPLNTTQNTAVIQVLSGCRYLRFADYANDLTNRYQFEPGSAATEYESYRGEEFALQLGQTVYGGSVDWNRGELLVDTCGIVFNGTENISLQENYNNTGTNRFSYAGTPVPVQESTALCSHMTFGYSPLGANNINNRIAVWKNGGLYWRFDRCATVSEMKAYFTEQYNAGTPVKVVYALAEPYTVKLAPVTIPALEGLNTVTSTGESMTLTYNKSLVREHGEIMARLAALEAAALGNT